jgi:hypothetical protein
VTLVAATFHATALVMLPFYFLCRIKFKRWLVLAVGMAAFPMSFLIGSMLGKIIALFPLYAAVYDSSSIFVAIINPLSVLRVIYPFTLLLFIVNAYDKVTSDGRARVFTNLTLFYIFIMLAFPGIPLVFRMNQYLEFAVVLVFIPLLCGRMKPGNSKLLRYCTLFYAVGLTTVTMLLRAEMNVMPFEMDFRLLGIPLLLMVACLMAACSIFVRLMSPGGKKFTFKKLSSKTI